MATKVFQLLCIFLITIFPLLSHARPSKNKAETPTSFDFIQNLEGCQNGQTVEGLKHLKTYLDAFGYLNYSPDETHANDDSFDDALEAAIKMYQLNFHLKPTGTLDAQTVSLMMAPRCGNPDIVNGTNWMRAGKKEANHTLNIVSHWASTGQRWPRSKYELTYAFRPGTDFDTKTAVASAFNTWSDESVFTFTFTRAFFDADLKIGYYTGDHGDGAPFTGPKGLLAHGFYPPVGFFHYNGDRRFSVDPTPRAHHLETVALHEIGHLLGLAHSYTREAIMYPLIPMATVKGLTVDDKAGIQALYG